MNLDDTDKKIINELQLSGRESASNIAEKIKVSVPTVTERIRKLQDSGVILGFQAIISPPSVGLDISAIITVISGMGITNAMTRFIYFEARSWFSICTLSILPYASQLAVLPAPHEIKIVVKKASKNTNVAFDFIV